MSASTLLFFFSVWSTKHVDLVGFGEFAWWWPGIQGFRGWLSDPPGAGGKRFTCDTAPKKGGEAVKPRWKWMMSS